MKEKYLRLLLKIVIWGLQDLMEYIVKTKKLRISDQDKKIIDTARVDFQRIEQEIA